MHLSDRERSPVRLLGARRRRRAPSRGPSNAAARAPSRPSRLRRALTTAAAEGAFAEVAPAVAGGAVLTAWALHLGAGPLAVGLLTALPHLLQALHVPGAWLTSRLGARRVALRASLAARQLHLGLAAIPWLGLPPRAQLALLAALAGASAALGVAASNAWIVWMSDLVHPRLRGRFFGGRAARGALVGAAAGGLASLALDRFETGAARGAALSALALAAWAAGNASAWLLARLPEPAPRRGALSSRARPRREGDAATRRRALLFVSAWSAALGLSGGFVPLHLVANLGLRFTSVALHAAGLAAAHLAAARAWSRRLDREGPTGVLRAASLPAALVPLVWLLPGRSALLPVAADAALTGVLLSGHALALVTLPMSLAPQQGRAASLAAFATAGGLSFGGAALASGLLVERLPPAILVCGRTFAPLHVAFAAGAAARLLAAALGWRLLGRRGPRLVRHA